MYSDEVDEVSWDWRRSWELKFRESMGLEVGR